MDIYLYMKKIPPEIQIRIDTIHWLEYHIVEISKLSQKNDLSDKKIKKLLIQLDETELRFEREKRELKRLGYTYPLS